MASFFSGVQLTLPSSSLFKFPPGNEPQALPPPIPGSTSSAPPYAIPSPYYNAVLDVKVPITIACTYAASVIALNAYNRSNGNKPWAISKTKIFFAFVVAHNIFLAVYSGWTFVGMLRALQRTVPRVSASGGLAGTVDSLCKMHGVGGLGNAIAYDGSASRWVSESPSTVFLDTSGVPDATDLGRLWNEGLAFYGWFFYLSKFYEVLDTVIILAKGKKSSTLQTYHHAGAMMCMWAGIRYMSPPIWMFVFVNSGIHALMYTYYTLTAFSVPIPTPLKRGLTTMQIIQFLVGSAYAAIHSFLSYTIPVRVPDTAATLKNVVSVAASSASAAASAGLGDMVKKYLFPVGEEAVAPQPSGDLTRAASTIHYHTEYQTVPCVDTSGQTFAIWLNVFYLAPLTVLFVRFFIRSYLRRTGHAAGRGVGHVTRHGAGEKSVKDALKAMDREVYQKGGFESGNGHANRKVNGKANGKH